MFIHIGSREIVSDRKIIGFFNLETIMKSEYNKAIKENTALSLGDIKTIVIDSNNDILTSKVSSFTVIKRTAIDDKDCVWRFK